MDAIAPDELRALVQRIIASGALGRSRTYGAILEYLVECSIRGETPKEAAIAVDVLGRESDFDVARDSIVRVHLYHLRNKLDSYFSQQGSGERVRLEIPKGQYVVVALANEAGAPPAAAAQEELPPPPPVPRRPRWQGIAAGLLGLLLLGDVALRLSGGEEAGPQAGLLAQAPWRALLEDPAPILVVVGDYFIFAELDEAGNVGRLLREFDINSAADMETVMLLDPERADRYYDLGLSYLPTSVASALADLMPLFGGETQRVTVKLASGLNAADLTHNHVLYLGYLSGMGLLRDLALSASGLRLGDTYDELVERDSGERYISDSGVRNTPGGYRDYGFVSVFPGPRGHQIVLVSGLRDPGLVNAAQQLSEAAGLTALNAALSELPADAGQGWEALFEVRGLDHTNLNARLLHTQRLDAEQIWSGRGGL